MASFSDLSFLDRNLLKLYTFKRFGTSPYTPLNTPLRECRVALITTGGFYLLGQNQFERIWGGDCSFREIPNTIRTQELAIKHNSSVYDPSDTKVDPNLVFPLDRFRELETAEKIGSLNNRHFSFMGSISRPKKLIQQTAPQVGKMLKDDAVDVVFLTPV